MNNDKIGWGFDINPNLSEAFAYLQAYFKDNNNPGALFWFTDKNGDTKLWTDAICLPYQLNLKLNEEIDIASIKLRSRKSSDVCYDHKLPNMAKAILVHDVMANTESQNDILTYDSLGRPLNHHQFYIGAGQCQYFGPGTNAEDYYEHNYDLVEPITVTRYAICENRVFTNLTSIDVTDASTGETSTYVQEPTNLLFMLENILKSTGVNTTSENTTWFKKIKIMDKDLLRSSAVGYNVTFNTTSLYDNLFKIGKYIKRYPVLYFNKDYDPTSQEDNENIKEFLLFFEKYDGSDMPSISMETFKEKSTGFMERQSSNNEGSIVSDCQNITSHDAVWYPGEGSWVSPTGEENQLIFNGTNSGNIKLPDNIDRILEIKCWYYALKTTGIVGSASDSAAVEVFSIPFKEKKDWLLSSAVEKKKSMWYERGKNVVDGFDYSSWGQVVNNKHCHNVLFPQISSYYSIGFSIKYVPLFSARIVKNKGNLLQKNMSQLDPTVDSDLFGSYLEHNAEANSACDFANGRVHTRYADIYQPGTLVEDEDKTLIISSVTIQRKNGYYVCSYQCNENVVKRSEIVDTSSILNSHKIDSEKTELRMTNVSDKKCYVSLSGTIQEDDSQFFKYLSIGSNQATTLFNGLINENNLPDSFYCYFSYEYQKLGESTVTNKAKCFVLPIRRAVTGNSICFTIVSKDSQWLAITTDNSSVKNASKTQKFNKYTDPLGKIKTVFLQMPNITADENSYTNTSDHYYWYEQDGLNVNGDPTNTMNMKEALESSVEKYPSISIDDFLNITNPVIDIGGLLYEKQTNEQLNITYQLDIESSDRNTIINPLFMKYILRVKENPATQFYMIAINSYFKIGKGDIISSAKCYHARCIITAGTRYDRKELIITKDSTDSNQFKCQNGWQLAIGTLRSDWNYDILIATRVNDLSDSLSDIAEFFLNYGVRE